MSSLFEIFRASLPYLTSGFQITVQIWAISIVLGVVLGLITCLMKISPLRPLRAVAWVYIWIIRGTPMLVQALVVYFGLPQVTGLRLTPFTAGMITLSLNAGAYLAEIFRSGIQAVPKGQSEAARSLGLGAGRTMAKIVLPQAFKIAVPPMVNQFIITLKDTSILTVIGLSEIVNESQQYIMIRWEYFQTYILVGLYYLVATSLMMALANYVEKKISYDRKGNRT